MESDGEDDEDLPAYRMTMVGREFIVTPHNSQIIRFFESSLIDHLEVVTEEELIAGYCPPELLEELENNGWIADKRHLDETEIATALGWFSLELTQVIDGGYW